METISRLEYLIKPILFAIIVFSLLMIYIFHYTIETDVIFTHLLYIPIVISAILWKRSAIFIAILFGLALLISKSYTDNGIVFIDVIRTLTFIFVAFVVYYFVNKNEMHLLKIAEKEKLLEASKIIIAQTEVIESQNEELKKLNADKDRFITILGHDLKNPFNSLLGLSGVLIEDIRELDIEQIEKIANGINNSARNTYNLLDDLLIWSRAQSNQITFNQQKLRLKDICINILETLKSNANAKNIKLNCFSADHIHVFADIEMLKTVLRNLVSNAIKYTNNDGAINITSEENSENITISISDNGIGMTPNDIAKLFDISQVLTTKGTAGETGTGLGLMICKEFIEKHSGKIWVESTVGKGSKFYFTIPESN